MGTLTMAAAMSALLNIILVIVAAGASRKRRKAEREAEASGMEVRGLRQQMVRPTLKCVIKKGKRGQWRGNVFDGDKVFFLSHALGYKTKKACLEACEQLSRSELSIEEDK